MRVTTRPGEEGVPRWSSLRGFLGLDGKDGEEEKGEGKGERTLPV